MKVVRREDIIAEMEENYPNIYSTFISVPSTESLVRVKQDPDFRATEAFKYPVFLRPVWRRTHTQAQSGSAVGDEDTATALYFGCLQSDTCTLANHKK